MGPSPFVRFHYTEDGPHGNNQKRGGRHLRHEGGSNRGNSAQFTGGSRFTVFTAAAPPCRMHFAQFSTFIPDRTHQHRFPDAAGKFSAAELPRGASVFGILD